MGGREGIHLSFSSIPPLLFLSFLFFSLPTPTHSFFEPLCPSTSLDIALSVCLISPLPVPLCLSYLQGAAQGSDSVQPVVGCWVVAALDERSAKLLLGGGSLLAKGRQAGLLQRTVELLKAIHRHLAARRPAVALSVPLPLPFPLCCFSLSIRCLARRPLSSTVPPPAAVPAPGVPTTALLQLVVVVIVVLLAVSVGPGPEGAVGVTREGGLLLGVTVTWQAVAALLPVAVVVRSATTAGAARTPVLAVRQREGPVPVQGPAVALGGKRGLVAAVLRGEGGRERRQAAPVAPLALARLQVVQTGAGQRCLNQVLPGASLTMRGAATG